MARARNIKPGFFLNDELGELPPLARLLFIATWTIADFRGIFEFKPKKIKAQCLPYDDCNIAELMNYLDKSGFVSIYSVQGQMYVKIMKFERHQTPHKNERDAGSGLPDISEKDKEINELKEDGKNPEENGTTPADCLLLIPDSLNLIPDSSSPKKNRRTNKTSLPEDFKISDSIKSWAQKKNVQNLELHFDSFIAKVKAKGYTYVDWDAALQNAISDNWAKIGNQSRASPPTNQSRHSGFESMNYREGVTEDGRIN